MSSGNGATSCEACHHLAQCHDNGVKDAGVFCSCEGGFVGIGFTCYNATACDDACCDKGYSWSPSHGCVDIDECSLPRPPCGPGQLCENTPGSYICLVTSDLRHHTKTLSVEVSCGGAKCPFGWDCLRVNGASRCADPCQHYTPLRDEWRATDYKTVNAKCDTSVDWNGWYRLFIRGTGVRMPERCIEIRRCGTVAPLWLKTRHPLGFQGIVQAKVCGHFSQDCCTFASNPIHVKACPGNYYVYKFVDPTGCYLGYCAGKQEVFTLRRYKLYLSQWGITAVS